VSAIGDYLTRFETANSMVETYKAKAVSIFYGLTLK
jgi:hypothetical protein